MAIFAKLSSSLLRTLQVLGTAYMIGVLSYFMVKLSRGHGRPSGHALALEIISGAGIVYATSMLLLSICLLQKHFFQFGSILMDLLFCGGFIAIAILLRSAPFQNCSSGRTATPNPQWLGRVGGRPSINCKLIEGLFGCAVGLAVLFFLTLLPAFLAMRSTKKDTTYHDDTPKQRGFTSFRRETRTNDVALPTRTLVENMGERPSADTAFTKDTEKGSDVGLGREYNRGYTATNSQTTGLAPAAVPVRTVSPLQSELYNSNNNHMNTTTYTTNEVNNGAYNGVHNDTYDNVSRTSELPTHTHDNGYNGTGNLEGIDPNVGGVTGNIYKLHMNRVDT